MSGIIDQPEQDVIVPARTTLEKPLGLVARDASVFVLRPRCQQCGYPLDGEPTGQPCPECGTPWVRAITHERGGETAVFAGVCGLASVLGCFLLFGAFGIGIGYVALRLSRRALVRVQTGDAPLWSANVAIASRYAGMLGMALGLVVLVGSVSLLMWATLNALFWR